MTENITENLRNLREKINDAAWKSGRNPETITLVAVSKKKPLSDVNTAIHQGQLDFGENYVQDYVLKCDALKNPDVRWHFIGHLQRNKVKDIVGRTHLLHTLDSLKLAKMIDKVGTEKNRIQDCLIQVNISKEFVKSGCLPDKLFNLVYDINSLRHVNLKGLMMIGTATDDENMMRGEFQDLRELLDEINSRQIYKNSLKDLSMGMSHQFEMAIEEGSTIIRVGTQIFGVREQ